MKDLFDWRLPLRDIGPQGVSGTYGASPEECRELARVMDLQACEQLRVDYKIHPLRSGMYRLMGHIVADVVQPCVVTLEPVKQHIDEAINTELRPADMLSVGAQDGEELSVLEGPDFEPIEDDTIDLGLIVLEHVSTWINPYPRAEGAELQVISANDDKAINPFAVLENLKK